MTVPCVAGLELNRYLLALDRDEARDRALSDRIDALLEEGGECDPLAAAHFIEGVSAIADSELAAMAALIRRGDYSTAAQILEAAVRRYWLKAAERKAEPLVTRCRHCFGRGCRYCEAP